jgi:hypothetical protein
MQFFGTVLYVDDVTATADFYRRAFGFSVRFFDEALGFAELETGGSVLAIAAHSFGEMLMPGHYSRPADGHPAGVEIDFLRRMSLLDSTKRLPKAAWLLRHQGGCPGVWRWRTCVRLKGQ